MEPSLFCRLDEHTSEEAAGQGSSAGRETAAAHMAALRELLVTHIGKLRELLVTQIQLSAAKSNNIPRGT
jgi:hypothetical protein